MTIQDPATLEEAAEREAHLEQLAREYAHHAAAAEPHIDRMEQIKAEYRELLDYGTIKAAGLSISIQRSTSFDTAAFTTAFPIDKHPAFYKKVPDQTAIKDTLPPALYRSFQKDGTKRVAIK